MRLLLSILGLLLLFDSAWGQAAGQNFKTQNEGYIARFFTSSELGT